MKTKISLMSIVVVIASVLYACSFEPSAEDARVTVEKYIKGVNERNPEVFNKYCGSDLRKTIKQLAFIAEQNNTTIFDVYPDNIELISCELISNFDDIAFAVCQSSVPENKFSIIMQLNNDGDWKMMYQENNDLSVTKDYVTSELLAKFGIYTVSHEDIQEAKELFGW